MAGERWETQEDILAALARFESSIDGYRPPVQYGIGIAEAGVTRFRYACRGDHRLPAAVLASVCAHVDGNHSYQLTRDQLEQAIVLLTPAEACPLYDHPNIASWRVVAAELDSRTTAAPVAVFVTDSETPPQDSHDAALRHALDSPQAFALDRVVGALRSMPEVIAIASYGSTADRSWHEYSDLDLFAVLAVEPPVESLRFFVDGVAVDLNFRAADDGARGIGGPDFMPPVWPVWDPDAVLARANVKSRAHDPRATQLVRYQFTHDLQKVRQIDDEVERRAACGLMAERVLTAWFQARDEPYPGMVAATNELRRRDPEALALISDALVRADVDLFAAAGERALGPVGGRFRPGDVLAPSFDRPNVEAVPDLFAPLVVIADGARQTGSWP